jgi:hypothetical protein
MNTLFDLKPYELPKSDINVILFDLTPIETECAICGKYLVVPFYNGYSLPMYEGKVVNPDIQKEWAGFMVHNKCYEQNEYKMYLDAFGIPLSQPL